jgi:ADP-dependent NAD(P)H-hydrate dehydratase
MPLPHLPPRKPDSHKGDYGHALLIGGSQGMAGSISLSGMACLRSGAGLVTVATADVCQPTVAGFEPSLMTVPLPSDEKGRIVAAALPELKTRCAAATAVACGPGLGRSDELTTLVATLYRELRQPLVVDADGLNALATQPTALPHHAGPRIFTPHPGEFARLSGQKNLTREQQCEKATELAALWNVVIVLKGHQTFITDGRQQAVNHTGNPGMATAGTGDVLTGIVTGMLCQGLPPFEAAQLAVHLHGLAGDLAAEATGQVSLIASDLLRFLPQAIRQSSAATD